MVKLYKQLETQLRSSDGLCWLFWTLEGKSSSLCIQNDRAVGAGGAMAIPVFDRSVSPISTKGDRLCSPYNHLSPLGFSYLPTVLYDDLSDM